METFLTSEKGFIEKTKGVLNTTVKIFLPIYLTMKIVLGYPTYKQMSNPENKKDLNIIMKQHTVTDYLMKSGPITAKYLYDLFNK